MNVRTRTGMRRHLSLVVSGGLVLVIGLLGVVAGNAAGNQAREVHREDRLALQRTLAGLVSQYVLLSAAEVADALGGSGAWSTAVGDPGSVERLRDLVMTTRALDAGAVLVSPAGRPLASWAPPGFELPAGDDPGWAPLRATAASGGGVLPLSGVLLGGGGRPLLAMGLPVALAGGQRGLVVGLWDARASALQGYVAELRYEETGHGYVIDAAGRAVAGPDAAAVGELLPEAELRAAVSTGRTGVVETGGRDDALLTSYASAGDTGWTALTPQDLDEFEGALVRSNRLVQVAVVALLLIAGTGLVVLHRKREGALESVALRDELTGLYNRRGWFVLAEHELERARRQRSPRVLLFVDLDGLKQVNDALGHREGDRAIFDAARVLTTASRSSDLVGRLGGDEFVLLLGEDGRADIARRRLAEALEQHNLSSSAAFELRLSIGAEVWFPTEACTLDELVRRADADMYADKTSRPSRHQGLLRLPVPRGQADAADSRAGADVR